MGTKKTTPEKLEEEVERIRSRSYLEEIEDCEHHIYPCGCGIDALQNRIDVLLKAYDAMRVKLNASNTLLAASQQFVEDLKAKITINPRRMAKFVYGSAGCSCRPGYPYCDPCVNEARRRIEELGLIVGEDPYPHEDI